jgi:hypothetical protein
MNKAPIQCTAFTEYHLAECDLYVAHCVRLDPAGGSLQLEGILDSCAQRGTATADGPHVQVLTHLKSCTAGTAKQETNKKYLSSVLKQIATSHTKLFQSASNQSAIINLLHGSKGLPELACVLLPSALVTAAAWPKACSTDGLQSICNACGTIPLDL